MSLPAFDPKSEAKQWRAAKAAKTAKAERPHPPTLAGLAALAGVDARNAFCDPPRLAALARFAERFHELAGFALSDGAGRGEADGQALHHIAQELRAKSPPAPSPSTECAHCLRGGEGLNPHLAANGGHLWLHRECWPAYDAARADAALRRASALLAEARAAGLTDTGAQP